MVLILKRQKPIRTVPKFYKILENTPDFIALYSFLLILRQKMCRIVPNFRKNLMQITASFTNFCFLGEAYIFIMLLLQKWTSGISLKKCQKTDVHFFNLGSYYLHSIKILSNKPDFCENIFYFSFTKKELQNLYYDFAVPYKTYWIVCFC